MTRTLVNALLWRGLHTLLSLGLNLLIERLRLNPRWRYVLWGAIALNELRGIIVVWETAPHLF